LLIAALAVFRRGYDPNATLALVGSASANTYEEALHAYVTDLGLSDAVTFTGAVSDAERNAYYATADVFVGLSGHEGFAVPFVEAWHHRVPIVTHAAAAVAETVGSAAIVLPTTDAPTVAAAIARVCGDGVVADGLRMAGLDRLEQFSLASNEATLLSLANDLAAGLADRPALLRSVS
jgi:glycosyltransferase involved in cell wall biosynthesis